MAAQISKRRVAFVVQRAGREVNGGAESHCLQVAQRMGENWNTEVLTTCALDYMEWQNHYPEGIEEAEGATIRRFLVDQPRDVTAFNRLSAKLHARQAATTIAEQEEWMHAQGPVSTQLLDYLRQHHDDYDAFIFFGYLYATTYFGLPLVRDRAFLVPLAHNEWPIHLPMWDPFFTLPRGFIFNTETERDFLRRRFPGLRLDGPVIAVGIQPPDSTAPSRFVQQYGLQDPFLLYVGRVDESKGCRSLFDYFLRARAERVFAYKLVLIGSEIMPIPFDDGIIHLGFVSEEEKWNAMAACDWLVVPSAHESLSMVLLEAWSVGRPAIVNGDCDVLKEHCQSAHGGLWYRDYAEWLAIFSLADAPSKAILGQQGETYVRRSYTWTAVERAYLEFFSEGAAGNVR